MKLKFKVTIIVVILLSVVVVGIFLALSESNCMQDPKYTSNGLDKIISAVESGKPAYLSNVDLNSILHFY